MLNVKVMDNHTLSVVSDTYFAKVANLMAAVTTPRRISRVTP